MKEPFLELMSSARRLPSARADFENSPVIEGDSLSPDARRLTDGLAPILDSIDWDARLLGPKNIRKHYEATYKLLVAEMARRFLRTKAAKLEKQYRIAQEATLAGTGGIPTFGRQIIAIIARAYPQMISPQLFPVTPLQGPEGRVYFENVNYGTAFASSTPNINPGDLMNDLTKFNTDYPNKGQMGDAQEIEYDVSNFVLVSAVMKRLGNRRSVEADEDYESFNGGDLEEVIRSKMDYLLAWVTDRSMINACVADVHPDNHVVWDAAPIINSVAYADLAPSEQQAWNETLWSTGVNAIKRKIFEKRYVQPDWAIAGVAAATQIEKVKSFVGLRTGDTNISFQTGAVRDFGTMDAGLLRVLIDPMMATNTILFGRRPQNAMEPAIHYCPLRPITFLPQLTLPRNAQRDSGAYTRFGIARPNTVAYGLSSVLGEVYALLTIANLS